MRLFFFGQQEQNSESPDAEDQPGDHPMNLFTSTVTGYDKAKNAIEGVYQCRRAHQRRGFHLGRDKKKSTQIT